ncbi:MAG: hypothetical protein HKN82_00110 [Akkermansiaceae bacterium]|nr:hypothetical protein [Akkermansiaceae bacterium]NNM29426.1 hypothetical protein [Akkermansiaceae bacterium]
MTEDRRNPAAIPGPAAAAVAGIAERLGPGVLFPLSYAVPRSLIVEAVPEKTRLLAGAAGRADPARAGAQGAYRFGPGEQDAYYRHYQESWFAETCRKGGWDCLRHLEIMMNGTIPIFAGLEDCPEWTLASYPRELLLQIRERHAPVLAGGSASVDDLDAGSLRRDAEDLLEFTRRHLHTEAMARYFLACMGAAGARSVLFLTRVKKPDYLCEMLLHGLRSVLGEGLVDVARRWWLYESAAPEAVGRLYGNGFTYTRHLEDRAIDRDRIASRIRAREFDLVIMANIERGTPFLKLVRQHYPRERVAIVDGGDYELFPGQPARPATRRPWRDTIAVPDGALAGAGVIFKREISEATLRAFEARRSGG